MGSIYKITNLKNNKSYIGQTRVNNPFSRLKDHYKNYKEKKCYSIYLALNKYGIENFSFQIIEDNIDNENLNEKEIYYINKFDCYKNGYNETIGGNYSSKSIKLTKEIVDKIKMEIECSGATFADIGERFGINGSLVSDINTGDVWRDSNRSYPLRVSHYGCNKVNDKDFDEIVERLKSGEMFAEIARDKKISPTTITAINNGKVRHNKNWTYPISIRSNCVGSLGLNDLKVIVDELKIKDKTESITKFSKRLIDSGKLERPSGVQRKTVSGINKGILYKSMLSSLNINKFPIVEV